MPCNPGGQFLQREKVLEGPQSLAGCYCKGYRLSVHLAVGQAELHFTVCSAGMRRIPRAETRFADSVRIHQERTLAIDQSEKVMLGQPSVVQTIASSSLLLISLPPAPAPSAPPRRRRPAPPGSPSPSA